MAVRVRRWDPAVDRRRWVRARRWARTTVGVRPLTTVYGLLSFDFGRGIGRLRHACGHLSQSRGSLATPRAAVCTYSKLTYRGLIVYRCTYTEAGFRQVPRSCTGWPWERWRLLWVQLGSFAWRDDVVARHCESDVKTAPTFKRKPLRSSSLLAIAPAGHTLEIVLYAFHTSFLALVIEVFVGTAELSRYEVGWKNAV